MPEPKPKSADEALRDAIKAALDAGDLARVAALVEVLRSSKSTTPVLALVPPVPLSRA